MILFFIILFVIIILIPAAPFRGAASPPRSPRPAQHPSRFTLHASRIPFHRRKLTALLSALLLLLIFRLALPFVSVPPALFSADSPQFQILDRNGIPLRTARSGSAPFQQRVGYSEIPQALVQATLAAEDRRFREHDGVDWRAVFRAACQFIAHRRVISGGSTITQQLIKLAEPRPRTFPTKFIESLQAMRLEQIWDKQRILCEYLNRLEYGNFNTGCSAAAQFYFGKPLRDLSTAECALLAGLPQAPSRLNPIAHLDRACKRQQWILSQMVRSGFLTSEENDRAKQQPLLFAPNHPFEAPHFVDLLLHISNLDYAPPSTLYAARFNSSSLRTTLDLSLNRFVEKTIQSRLFRLRSEQVRNAATVVIENKTGNVLALVGSENYFAPASGQVNGAWAPRSAGSTFKPFTYLLAFERGATPATIVADVPTDFVTATGLFSPVNYNHHCYGPMRYRLALANSLNISAVKVLSATGGPEPLRQLLQAFGLTTLTRSAEDYGLGLTIGNAEARLLELANAYACLARLGEYRPYRLTMIPPLPRLGAEVRAGGVGQELSVHRDGKTSSSHEAIRVADASAAYLIADILSDNAARTLAFGTETPLCFEFPVACKTGTSSDFRDNWAFGYTPEFTVGVWVGNFDGSPMQGVSGITGAGPILHDVFEQLHSEFGTTWYATPENIVECAIHPITGQRVPSLGAPASLPAITEKFLASNLPPLDLLGTAHASEPALLGPEYRAWISSADNWLADRVALSQSTASLRITFPLPGTTFYLDPDLPQQGRRIRLRAEGSGQLHWQSNSLQVKQESGQQLALLAEGRHDLIVSDPHTGEKEHTWIAVFSR